MQRRKVIVDKWTPIIIVLLPLGIGLLDVFLLWLGGNQATISAVMLRISWEYPLVPLSTAYSFSVLMGHLFFPEFASNPPPTYEVIARMVLVLSPTFYALIIIGAGGDTAESSRQALRTGGQWVFAAYMVLAAITGGLLGHYLLPQHVSLPGV